jgi:hypothetical protein
MCRDGVDQTVRAELVRVVDEDGHTGLDARPDEQAGLADVALAEPLVLGAQLRHDGRDDRSVQ